MCVQYRFYGEPVVKACVENGAHCVDISGEPQVHLYTHYDSEYQVESLNLKI